MTKVDTNLSTGLNELHEDLNIQEGSLNSSACGTNSPHSRRFGDVLADSLFAEPGTWDEKLLISPAQVSDGGWRSRCWFLEIRCHLESYHLP